jgi:hypothetical protein
LKNKPDFFGRGEEYDDRYEDTYGNYISNTIDDLTEGWKKINGCIQ